MTTVASIGGVRVSAKWKNKGVRKVETRRIVRIQNRQRGQPNLIHLQKTRSTMEEDRSSFPSPTTMVASPTFSTKTITIAGWCLLRTLMHSQTKTKPGMLLFGSTRRHNLPNQACTTLSLGFSSRIRLTIYKESKATLVPQSM